jgi:hypothetical protein
MLLMISYDVGELSLLDPDSWMYVPCTLLSLRSLDFIGITKLDRDKMMMWEQGRKAARQRYLATH